MIHVVSVENMRESDRKTIESGVSSLLLMYRAAYGIFLSHHWEGKTVICVGSGNNGGDGFALANILNAHQYECAILIVGKNRTNDAKYYEEKAVQQGIKMVEYLPGNHQMEGADTIVDCLLGTGFKGELRGLYAQAIKEINHTDAYRISVDINSGMNGDSGEAVEAVVSDKTVTIGFIKKGMLQREAYPYVQHIVCADIGIELDQYELTLDDFGIVDANDGVLQVNGLKVETLDIRDIVFPEL